MATTSSKRYSVRLEALLGSVFPPVIAHLVVSFCERFEQLATLSGHAFDITQLVDIGNGRLASASHDNMVRIWDLETSRCIHVLEAHFSSVTSLVLVKGLLASGSYDRLVVWDIEHFSLIHLEEGNFAHFVGLPTGTLAVLGTSAVRVWELVYPPCVQYTLPPASVVGVLDVMTVTGGEDGRVRVFHGQKCIRTLAGHRSRVVALAPLPLRQLASGSAHEVRIWDVKTGVCVLAFSDPSTLCGPFVFSSDPFAGVLLVCHFAHHFAVYALSQAAIIAVLPTNSEKRGIVALKGGRFVYATAMGLFLWTRSSGSVQLPQVDNENLTATTLLALSDGMLVSAFKDVIIWG